MRRTSKVKIAFFIGSFKHGGTEYYLLRLLQNLDREKFDPLVICFRKSGRFLPEVQKLNVSIYTIPMTGNFFSFSTMASLWKASSILRQNNVQIIHALANWSNFFGCAAGKIAGVPIIIAGQRNMGHWMVRKRYRLASWFTYKYLADGVLVNAYAIQDNLVREFNILKKRIYVIHNGILINSRKMIEDGNKIQNNKIVVGYVGRLDHIKGFDFLIEAARKTVREQSKVIFLIVGDGTNYDEYKTKIDRCGLKEYFQFVGHQDNVFTYINEMDFLVLPSRSEGFPNVIIEAMACRKPVVASCVGGVPEAVIDGKTGFLVEPGDVQALVQAIRKLCCDKILRRTMGQEAFKRVVEHFEMGKLVTKHQNYYYEKLGMTNVK